MNISSAHFWYRYYFRYARTGKPRVPAPHHHHANIHYIALCAKKAAHGYVNLCNDSLRLRQRRLRNAAWHIDPPFNWPAIVKQYPILKLDPRRLP